MSYSSIDKKCTNCGCLVDSHHDKWWNCLVLHCDCPLVNYIKPKTKQEARDTSDRKPHSGHCGCAGCREWYIRQWT